jgi:hypothetical protein
VGRNPGRGREFRSLRQLQQFGLRYRDSPAIRWTRPRARESYVGPGRKVAPFLGMCHLCLWRSALNTVETIRPHTVSTAETTDCSRSSRRALGWRHSGRTTEAVWYPEVSRVVRATQSRQWFSQGSFCPKVVDARRRADSLRGWRGRNNAV